MIFSNLEKSLYIFFVIFSFRILSNLIGCFNDSRGTAVVGL